MIADKDVAAEISTLLLNMSEELNTSIIDVERRCATREFEAYRRAMASVIGEIFLEVLTPLYVQHPDLKPSGWR